MSTTQLHCRISTPARAKIEEHVTSAHGIGEFVSKAILFYARHIKAMDEASLASAKLVERKLREMVGD